MTPIPGWYPDPADPDTQRYWDGEQWLGAPLPVGATPPPGPPPVEPSPAGATPSAPSAQTGWAPGWTPPASGTPGAGTTGTDAPGGPGTPGWAAPGTSTPGAGTPGAGTPGGAMAPGVPGTGAPGWGAPGTDGPGTDGPRAGKPRWGQPATPLPPVPPGHIRVPGTTATIPIDATKLAPLGLRVLARVIDVVAVFLLCLVVNGYFYLQFAEEIGPNINDILLGQETLSAEASRLNWIIFVLTIGLWFAYEVPATANSGQTLGKRIVGIRVIRVVDDKSLTFGQSIRRWLILMLPSPTVSFLCGFPLQLADLLWCLWDRPARQCLHDKVVTSIVVRSAAVPLGPASEAEKPN